MRSNNTEKLAEVRGGIFHKKCKNEDKALRLKLDIYGGKKTLCIFVLGFKMSEKRIYNVSILCCFYSHKYAKIGIYSKRLQ